MKIYLCHGKFSGRKWDFTQFHGRVHIKPTRVKFLISVFPIMFPDVAWLNDSTIYPINMLTIGNTSIYVF